VNNIKEPRMIKYKNSIVYKTTCEECGWENDCKCEFESFLRRNNLVICVHRHPFMDKEKKYIAGIYNDDSFGNGTPICAHGDTFEKALKNLNASLMGRDIFILSNGFFVARERSISIDNPIESPIKDSIFIEDKWEPFKKYHSMDD